MFLLPRLVCLMPRWLPTVRLSLPIGGYSVLLLIWRTEKPASCWPHWISAMILPCPMLLLNPTDYSWSSHLRLSVDLQRTDENITIDTTLLVHFFGKKGKAELTFEDFYRYQKMCSGCSPCANAKENASSIAERVKRQSLPRCKFYS